MCSFAQKSKSKIQPANRNAQLTPDLQAEYQRVTKKILEHIKTLNEDGEPKPLIDTTHYNTDSLKKRINNLNVKIKNLEKEDKPDKFQLAEYFYDLGMTYERNKEIKSALKALIEMSEVNPKHKNGLLELARISIMIKDYENAILSYTRVIKTDPKDLFTYWLLGQAYDYVMIVEPAALMYKKLIIMGTINGLIYQKIGIMYYNASEYKKALVPLKQSLSYDSLNVKTLYILGVCNSNNKDIKNAVKTFNKILTISPNHAEAYYNLGVIYSYTGDETKSKMYLELAKKYKKEGK